jgi:hypothetical protein
VKRASYYVPPVADGVAPAGFSGVNNVGCKLADVRGLRGVHCGDLAEGETMTQVILTESEILDAIAEYDRLRCGLGDERPRKVELGQNPRTREMYAVVEIVETNTVTQ